jgi:hypothetical protein
LSLTKYLHQVRPREESYVNHVDRIQGLFTISEGQAGLDYETKVFGVMMDYQKTRPGFFGLGQGDMPGDTPVQTAGYDGGVDIEATVNNESFNIEVKLNKRAQLGSGKIFVPFGADAYASENFKKKTDPDDLALILKAVDDPAYRKDVDSYLKKLAILKPSKRSISGVSFSSQELTIYKNVLNHTQIGIMGNVETLVPHIAAVVLKKDGLQSKISRNVALTAKTIANFYNDKEVYYIQFGGSGLYHLNKDPLNLGTPLFDGSINIELRIKPDGDSRGSRSESFTKRLRNLGGQEFVDKLLVVQDIELKRLMKGKELQNFVNATKKHPPSDSFPYTGKIKLKNPTGLIQARTRAIYANGRFTGTLAKSDHTLDTLEGLEKMFGAE